MGKPDQPLPPHPATIARRQEGFKGSNVVLPKHAATIVQENELHAAKAWALGVAPRPAPHAAQRREAPTFRAQPSSVQRSKLDDKSAPVNMDERLGSALVAVAKKLPIPSAALLELMLAPVSVSLKVFIMDVVFDGNKAGHPVDRPLAAFLQYMIESRRITGVCGNTSQWLDEVTSKSDDGDAGKFDGYVEPELPMVLMESAETSRWFCRLTDKAHSVLIECVKDMVYVYQSFYAAQSLDTSLVDFWNNKKSHFYEKKVFIKQIQQALVGKNADRQEALFYGCKWTYGTDVQCRVNTDPAPVKDLASRVAARLKPNQDEWMEKLRDEKTPTEDVLVTLSEDPNLWK